MIITATAAAVGAVTLRRRDVIYHLEMILSDLDKVAFGGDTRASLFIDRTEQALLRQMCEAKLTELSS